MKLQITILLLILTNNILCFNLISSDITTIINNKRASEIKKILKTICTDNELLSYKDKESLSSLLLSKEIDYYKKYENNIIKVELIDIDLGKSKNSIGLKKYIGIDIIINNKINGRFLIDTGATTNLIKSDYCKNNNLNFESNVQMNYGKLYK